MARAPPRPHAAASLLFLLLVPLCVAQQTSADGAFHVLHAVPLAARPRPGPRSLSMCRRAAARSPSKVPPCRLPRLRCSGRAASATRSLFQLGRVRSSEQHQRVDCGGAGDGVHRLDGRGLRQRTTRRWRRPVVSAAWQRPAPAAAAAAHRPNSRSNAAHRPSLLPCCPPQPPACVHARRCERRVRPGRQRQLPPDDRRLDKRQRPDRGPAVARPGRPPVRPALPGCCRGAAAALSAAARHLPAAHPLRPAGHCGCWTCSEATSAARCRASGAPPAPSPSWPVSTCTPTSCKVGRAVLPGARARHMPHVHAADVADVAGCSASQARCPRRGA